jgi:hypothetical protein
VILFCTTTAFISVSVPQRISAKSKYS